MPVSVLSRTLQRNGIETAAASHEDTLEATWTIRFEESISSPQAAFRILAEDGTLAYSIHTTIGDEWRNFDAGHETEVKVRFQPRFGGGGTFRLLLDITDITGVHVLGTDTEGPRIYVGPRPGTGGLGDALATIDIDNFDMTKHRSLAMDGRAADTNGSAEVPRPGT
jgi:hypothetical protein